jgi:hypothetical protein
MVGGGYIKAKVNVLKYFLKILNIRGQRRYAFRWLSSVRKGHLLDRRIPWIPYDVIEFLKKHVHNGAYVFEYGTGGSTLFWLSLDASCIAIEHDPEWYNVMRARLNSSDKIDYRLILPEKCHDQSQHLNCADPDICVSSVPQFKGFNFINYVSQIDSFPDEYFDFVLIDGRARPSCIKHSIKKVKINGMLIVDDSDRLYYFSKTIAYLENFERKRFYGVCPALDSLKYTDVYRRVK